MGSVNSVVALQKMNLAWYSGASDNSTENLIYRLPVLVLIHGVYQLVFPVTAIKEAYITY